MSSRAGRSRFFIGLVSLLLMIGFVAIFHSSQQQLDESRELRLRCEQQQEALNSRLQAIVEHKFRVEKALETERREHLETKQHFEYKIKELKDTHNKAQIELNTRFESLQQHYKLLESEHNDLVEDCMKTKENQLEEIHGIKSKIKSLLAQVQQTKNQTEKTVEKLKLKLNGLMQEKERLEVLLRAATSSNDYAVQRCKRTNENLEKLISDYKNHCEYQPRKHENENAAADSLSNLKDIEDHYTNKNEINQIAPNLLMNGVELNNQNKNSGATEHKINNNDNSNKQVLQQPPPLHSPIKLSTASSNPLLKASSSSFMKSSIRPEALYASVVAQPTSEKNKKSSSTLANDRYKESGVGGGRLLKSKPIPIGVVPVPENFEALIKNDENNQSGEKTNGNIINNNNNNNNRYANVVDELSGKKDQDDDLEQDNGAQEVKDDINIGDEKNVGIVDGGGEGKDHLQDILDNVNNAAEDDTNNFIDSKGLVGHSKNNKDNEVEVVGGNKIKKDKGDNLLGGDNKLINEVVGDQGKEPPFSDGMHLEEGEEDEDEDDYSNPAARQQEGPAIRN